MPLRFIIKHITISKASFFVSASALAFQTSVLFPWHETISVQIGLLEKKINNLETTIQKIESKK